MFVLTRSGKNVASQYICDMIAKRKHILQKNLDTGQKTRIPTCKDIEKYMNVYGIDKHYPSGPCYFNYLNVTDNTKADYPIVLTYGVDFVEKEFVPRIPEECSVVETYDSGYFYRMIPGTIVVDSKYQLLWQVKSTELLNIEVEEYTERNNDNPLKLAFRNSDNLPFFFTLFSEKILHAA